MGLGGRMEEVIPFALMVTMEGCTIGLTILAKTAMNRGISPFVFIVYTNTIGSICLLPYSFFFHRNDSKHSPQQQLRFSFPLLLRFFLLGLTGIGIAQSCAFMGLYYSSPIVVCVMGLTLPAISFMLSLLLRRTKLEWKCYSFRVKAIGTLISVIGATTVEIYKGPFIRKATFSQLQLQGHKPPLFIFYSTPDRWILGGVLLAVSSLSVSIWNIIQVGTVKQYPQVMKVASFYSLVGTLQCAIIGLFVERDLNAWKLKLNMDLLLIVVTGVFGSVIRTSVHVMCTRKKGTLYVPMFKPFGIVFATTFGLSFFTNALHYGSVIGAVITGMGYYSIMWGQIREEESQKLEAVQRVMESSDEKVPLLQPRGYEEV